MEGKERIHPNLFYRWEKEFKAHWLLNWGKHMIIAYYRRFGLGGYGTEG